MEDIIVKIILKHINNQDYCDTCNGEGCEDCEYYDCQWMLSVAEAQKITKEILKIINPST